MDESTNFCYTKCNELYTNPIDPRRTYCKKGCSSDSKTPEECHSNICAKLCIKEEISSDGNKWGSWSKVFSRAPANSSDCLEACYYGCSNSLPDEGEN